MFENFKKERTGSFNFYHETLSKREGFIIYRVGLVHMQEKHILYIMRKKKLLTLLEFYTLPRWSIYVSVVYRCFFAASFACKAIDKRLLTDPIDKLFHLLSAHPNTIQLFHLYEDDDAFLLVTDRRN
ncbi:hypothetical protein RJ640_007074 [Escallonia rubra]|uniref:Uncharacterized protein n=1 Tax=Escallonia rubra TaxID=112253 RepID=A0AA88RJ86_9ASTE|nr:hypothetical protein RJ640_007074 [Escallonia rubra]